MNRYKYANLEEFLKHADTLGIELHNDLSDNLETVYEWEYKFHKINNSQSTNEKRKSFILQRINLELNLVLDNVIQDLSNVYKKWLNEHALNSPRTWAESRVNDLEEFETQSGLDNDSILELVLQEYLRYVNSEKEEFNREFIEINNELLLPYIQNFINDEIEYYVDELENTKNKIQEQMEFKKTDKTQKSNDNIYYLNEDAQEFTQRINDLNEQRNDPDVEDYINTYYSSLNEFLKNINTNDLKEMITNMYEEVIFPAWYGVWQEKDIDTIRINNDNIYNQLQSADTLNDKFKIINIALNSVHVTGKMIDYINNIDSRVDSDFLSYLSNIDTSQWDKELVLLGIK